MIYGWFYRTLMKLAHRYHWHYAPLIGPIGPDGDMQRWCRWCGFRQTILNERKIISALNAGCDAGKRPQEQK